MSARISPGTGRRYGVERVCRVWGVPRSSFYAQRRGAEGPPEARRRGPAPIVADGDLLAMIRDDLKSSPFVGEGYRKVWARLRVAGVRVRRERVLRLMREARLLSPHRVRQGPPRLHDGTITTTRPDDIWGTDGARVETVEDGLVWVFIAVDHCHAECVGWHVAKRGNRFAALQPIAMGLRRHRGSVERGAGQGVTVRMDHGTQYVADDFRHQLRAWAITPSYAFVAEPQTNGVAERFIRTLKEQAVHGRIFRTLEDVRDAVRRFVELYNSAWRVEKNGFLTPNEAREQHALAQAA